MSAQSAENDALAGFVPPPTICPHPSYHNVCDACVREYRARVIPPVTSYPDMPCEDCEQRLSTCCVPPVVGES